MTATDDRVWSEFGLCTPEQIAVYRVQALAEADVCQSCTHLRREHFPDRCAHTITSADKNALRHECGCNGFKAVSDPMTPEEAL